MKYLKQFFIILLISFIGEILRWFIPLPIPASIYGLVLMLAALCTGIVKVEKIEETSKFLIDIMPVMFVPPTVALLDSWDELKEIILPIGAIIVITTIVVMAVTGRLTQGIIRREEKKNMNSMMQESVFFGVAISLLGFEVGLLVKKKFKSAIFNPMLVAVVLIILFLIVFDVDYETYNSGAKYLSYLLTPATVCLAVPLYQQLQLLKQNAKAVMLGISGGVITSLTSVLLLSKLFGLNHQQYVTLLPKSITTAIGIGLSEEMGGLVTITVASIAITGTLGNIMAEVICKIFRITEPIAKGLAIGTSAHAMGTAKALEMGEIEGAMSGLAIAVAGLLTVIMASFYANLM